MNELTIKVYDADGSEIAAAADDEYVHLVLSDVTYGEGFCIRMDLTEAGQFYMVKIDETLEETLLYFKENTWVYQIPCGEKKEAYCPQAFTGNVHFLSLRKAEEHEWNRYRNLAKNPLDQQEAGGCFPHASANTETRGEAVFAARNVIDGICANRFHGIWPYQSWGINRQEDAALTLDFGIPVDIDRIDLWTRADFPHDSWWDNVTFLFSDGSEEYITLEKKWKPHRLKLARQGITWIKMCHMHRGSKESPFPALTQIEVYGIPAE